MRVNLGSQFEVDGKGDEIDLSRGQPKPPTASQDIVIKC